MSILRDLLLNRRSPFGLAAIPRDCLLCGSASEQGSLCVSCRTALPRLPAARCPICASPSPASAICGACLADPPFFQRTVAAAAYAFPVDALIQACKYAGNLAAGRALSELLADVISREPAPDVIIPMPLHPARLRERGFNQALEIARPLAAATGVPLVTDACARIKDTRPQVSLPRKQRHRNMRGAFSALRRLDGMRIAIVDDVITTGNTLNEAAKALRRAGAARVDCWIAARALSDAGIGAA